MPLAKTRKNSKTQLLKEIFLDRGFIGGIYDGDKWREACIVISEWLKEEPKSEWQKDHEILKAYSDGADEVLDKIRAEIETKYGQCDICEYITDYDGFYHQIGDIADILWIIDKYKAESEKSMRSLSQNIIEHAKRLYPKALIYKGQLTDAQFCEVEKECDIDFYKLVSQDIRYTIRYKVESE